MMAAVESFMVVAVSCLCSCRGDPDACCWFVSCASAGIMRRAGSAFGSAGERRWKLPLSHKRGTVIFSKRGTAIFSEKIFSPKRDVCLFLWIFVATRMWPSTLFGAVSCCSLASASIGTLCLCQATPNAAIEVAALASPTQPQHHEYEQQWTLLLMEGKILFGKANSAVSYHRKTTR